MQQTLFQPLSLGWTRNGVRSAIRSRLLQPLAVTSAAPCSRVASASYSVVVLCVAGAPLTQTTLFISIDVPGFPRSAKLLLVLVLVLVLVLRGTASLYGVMLGATVFMTMHHLLAGLQPQCWQCWQFWQFWLGLVLIFVVLFARAGIMGALRRLARRFDIEQGRA